MILEKTIQRNDAVIAEQARAAKAGTHASTPGSRQNPQQSGEPAKVNSVRDLAGWFNDQTSK